MKSLAIVVGGIALATCTFSLAAADDVPLGVSSAHLASMGLAGMQPMSEPEGDQVRGNPAIVDFSGPFSIPLGPVSGNRLVFRLNWSDGSVYPDLRTLLCRLLDERQTPELIPPGPRE
ncbi:MAG TPA: hypothetical protein VL175_21695, partial [Pirellulales bacterium]|nr:hypothetical protein [Pirellulales bacterium]